MLVAGKEDRSIQHELPSLHRIRFIDKPFDPDQPLAVWPKKSRALTGIADARMTMRGEKAGRFIAAQASECKVGSCLSRFTTIAAAVL